MTTRPDPVPTTIPVEVLTDEELSVLTPDQGVVVTPVLSAMAPGEVDVARRTAFRGLLARGIVDPPGPEAVAAATAPDGSAGGDAAVDLRVRNDVLSALTLRQAASAVVAVARTTSSVQDFWYAHVVEEIVLLEDVGTDGLHRFALGHARDLAAMVVAAAVHPDATDVHGEPIELPAAPDSEAPAELVSRLGEAYLRADVLVVTRAGDDVLPTLTGVFTGPRGSWSVLARPGSHRAFATPETVASLRDKLEQVAAVATATTTATTTGTGVTV